VFFIKIRFDKKKLFWFAALVSIEVHGEPGQDLEEPHHEGGVLLLISQGQYQEGILHFTQQIFYINCEQDLVCLSDS
jgi:hypothetical protein